MSINLRQQESLKNLRQDLQEDAGADFPSDVMTQLLVLYDVSKALDLNCFEVEYVLGETGYQAVNEHIGTPIGTKR